MKKLEEMTIRDNFMFAAVMMDGDPFTRKLKESIRRIKISREMRKQYMNLTRMMKEEREEGRKEGQKIGQITTLCQLVDEQLLPIDAAVQKSNLSESEFRQHLAAYQKQ